MWRTIESDEYREFDDYFPDITFHRAIADASGNRLLSLFMLSIHLTLRTLAERYVLPSKLKQVSQDQHRLVYEAILDRDEKLARARMEEHLRMAYEVYRQAVPTSAEDPPAERSEYLSTDDPVDVSRPKASRKGPELLDRRRRGSRLG